MSLGRNLTRDDEGKSFRTRSGSRVKIISVSSQEVVRYVHDLAVRRNIYYPFYLVMAVDDENELISYKINGFYLHSESARNLDLISEGVEVEPELNLGPEHVGRKVRLKDGSVVLIGAFIPSAAYPIRSVCGLAFTISGRAHATIVRHNVDGDIVELLD